VRLPFAGRIVLDPADSPIAYVVQEAANALLPWRTLLSNMLLPAQLQGHVPLDVQERAMSLLSRFGLKDRAHDFPYKLSGGERQILNLVRALLTPASIVLLDEPFAPLNAVARLPAASLMLEYASARTTILVTHDPADLDWPFTRYFEIADSQVVEADRARIKRQLDRGLRSVVG
jgi:NitT/TauT family transport system ATP-binding protein